jgi:PPE-repeat protein
MSFSLFAPEINSALMFTGAGSEPLLSAATAWDGLAADLESTATQYQTLVTNLTTGPWLGPSSAQMASATAPYIAWLQGTAATAAQTGAQAKAAAAAYQTAYSSMVPLPTIAENRAELATLVANNFLGQNTGAIAINESNYLDMWIQDALGMDTYQLNSQAASAALPAQVAAPQVASGALASTAAAPAASSASSASTVIGSLLTDFAQLFGVSGDSALNGGSLDLLGYLSTLATGVSANPSAALLPVQVTYYMGMLGSTPARMFMSSGSSASGASTGTLAGMSDSLLANVTKLVDSKAAAVMGGVGNQLHSWGSSVAASLAGSHRLGGLSVPHGWHGGAPDMARAAPTLPATSVAAPSMMSGLPSSPFAQGLMGAMAGRGVTSLGSRVAAKVMPRSPAGG